MPYSSTRAVCRVQVVANNMMAAVYNDHVDNAENDSVIVTTFRICCAVPPLLCALLWRDFASIVGYAGETKLFEKDGDKIRQDMIRQNKYFPPPKCDC